MRDLVDGDVLEVTSRRTVPTSVRFSEPPISPEAREQLCHYVKLFIPIQPRAAVQPMSVRWLPNERFQAIVDRLESFEEYDTNRDRAILHMGRLFNAASSALAAYASIDDDTQIHRVQASVSNLDTYPLQFDFVLSNMNSNAGWDRHRMVEVWAPNAESFFRMEVRQVDQQWRDQQLHVTLRSIPWSERTARRTIPPMRGHAAPSLPLFVRLAAAEPASRPAYEVISQMNLLADIPAGSMGRQILDAAYGGALLSFAVDHHGQLQRPTVFVDDDATIVLQRKHVTLTEDQRQAVALGCAEFPVVGIQAAYGTGKTVVAAAIAARLAKSDRKIILTATTNAAVAQITNTFLAMGLTSGVKVCRFIAETIAYDETVPATAADMHLLLKALAERLRHVLNNSDYNTCVRFREGRLLLEDHRRHGDDRLTASQREELLLAERDVSDLIDSMVNILFAHVPPQIVAITTASLLAATGGSGIFANHLDDFELVVCDEASQVPEPVFAAIISRLPRARHIYVGDLYQLQPFARCSRDNMAVYCGARSVMQVLTSARAVPMAPLITTFRAHPRLNGLPNSFVYDGTLRSGTPASARRLLLDILRFPCRDIPFMFLHVDGQSQRALSRSLYNEEEAKVCMNVVSRLRRAGIAASNITVITFYKEQQRRLTPFASNRHIELATVDSIQGRENDVIIVLTTRTDFTPESGEFIADRNRVNVALTRCRHGQFVLGDRQSLMVVPSWKSVLTWAEDHGCVVNASTFERCFIRH